MAANRILYFIIFGPGIVIFPIQLVMNLVFEVLIFFSFGLLLLPLSLLWAILIFPLIGASWLCNRIEYLRNPVGILGIPWAFVAHTFAAMVPSLGEVESRADKMMLTESWPFSWEYWQFGNGRLDMWSDEGDALRVVLDRISARIPLRLRTVRRLAQHEPLDSEV